MIRYETGRLRLPLKMSPAILQPRGNPVRSTVGTRKAYTRQLGKGWFKLKEQVG